MISNILRVETQHSLLEELREADLHRVIEIRMQHTNSVLNKIHPFFEEQQKYYALYKNRNAEGDEVYYKIYDKNYLEKICGLVRITQLNEAAKFSWESFILEQGTNPVIAYDVMLTIFSLGFDFFHKEICGPWDVPKSAGNILHFHKNAGISELVGEDGMYLKMRATKSKFYDRINYFRLRGMARIIDTK